MANIEFNTFIKGLITDANPLTYPENTSSEEVNMVLNKDGSRNRRLGLKTLPNNGIILNGNYLYHAGTISSCSSSQNKTFNSFFWKNAGNTNKVFFVNQIEDKVYIRNVSDESKDFLHTEILYTIDLYDQNFSHLYQDLAGNCRIYLGQDRNVYFTSGNGFLYITGERLEPLLIIYNPVTNTFSKEYISIETRDFDGLGYDDVGESSFDANPSTLTDIHNYNLHNQGWNLNLINNYFTTQGVYPSNAEVWTAGKNATDDFDSNLLVKVYFGQTPAPRGKNILKVLDRIYTDPDDVNVILERYKQKYSFSTIQFYAGRVFLSGLKSQPLSGFNYKDYSGSIFFSKTIQSSLDVEKCYQQADPTSEVISDIIDSDGGEIRIPEADIILKLVPFGNSLIVFATNGVWSIGGVDGYFKATAYTVEKLSDIGALSQNGITSINGAILFTAEDGIYIIQAPNGGISVDNLTKNVINKYYNSIAMSQKKRIKIAFDNIEKKLYFLHNFTDEEQGKTKAYKHELIFDINLGAFYTNSFSTGVHYIVDINFLYLNNDPFIYYFTAHASNPEVPLFTGYVLKTATKNDTLYKDFNNNFSSYIVTGYNTFKDTMRNKNIEYIIVSLRKTEKIMTLNLEGGTDFLSPSSCLMQIRWDFTNSPNSNKWSTPYQVYRQVRPFIHEADGVYDDGYEVVQTKNKVRGHGRALSIKFESEEGKEMHIYGWALSIGGNSRV